MNRRISPKQWLALVRAAVNAWIDDYAQSMGAALSYYTIFSLAPLLLIVIAVAGLIFGREAASGEVFAQFRGLMGDEAALAVTAILGTVGKPAASVAATILGSAILLIGATSVFAELQSALDRIWRAPTLPRSWGLWHLVRTRLLSFGLILGLAFLLMVSLVLSAAISALAKWWGPAFGRWELLAQGVNMLVSFGLTTGGFAMIYKLMPRARVHWRDVWLGAIVTSLLFEIGKFLIGFYIGKSGVALSFGAASSLIVIFIWVYYSAQIFLIGAEFTWVYARTFGSRRNEPRSNAAQGSSVPAGASANH